MSTKAEGLCIARPPTFMHLINYLLISLPPVKPLMPRRAPKGCGPLLFLDVTNHPKMHFVIRNWVFLHRLYSFRTQVQWIPFLLNRSLILSNWRRRVIGASHESLAQLLLGDFPMTRRLTPRRPSSSLKLEFVRSPPDVDKNLAPTTGRPCTGT